MVFRLTPGRKGNICSDSYIISRKETKMAGAATITRISQVGTVFVPVTDQDRALTFYLDKLGFEKRGDFPYGRGLRWIEVAPPGSANRIALVPRGEGPAPVGVQTYCAFSTPEIETDHATLRARGVDVSEIARTGTRRSGLFSDEVIVDDPMPPQFYFRDLDGNRFLVVQAI
jgi:catechol 2,3-dioxygenase-like lactoylglutathione lyase family enzyme